MRYLLLAMLISGCTPQPKKEPDAAQPAQPSQRTPEWAAGKVYRDRYQFKDARQKLVDNKGEGREELHGTRNFRAVLNGIYYRGGANNKYRKEGRKENSNPLPPEGLRSLCQEGFTEAVYLYERNFSSAATEVSCRTFAGKDNSLKYYQLSPLRNKREDIEKLLRMIYRHVRDPGLGPIYDHCWNGWHASGMVAAATLRQFCGFTSEQAEAYWIVNTDGDPKYPRVQKQVRDFKPLPDLQLTPQERKELCPDPESLKFEG